MVSPSTFVDGADVQWSRLARTLVGGAFGAVFMGWTSVVLGVADLVIRPIEWFAGWLGRLVDLLASTPVRFVGASWDGAVAFVVEGGPLAFVFAISIVLLTLYVVVRVVRLA